MRERILDVGRWAINENAVDEADEDWHDVFRKQVRVPIIVGAVTPLFLLTVGEIRPLHVAAAIPVVVYSSLPALGAYAYIQDSDGTRIRSLDDRAQMIDPGYPWMTAVLLTVLLSLGYVGWKVIQVVL